MRTTTCILLAALTVCGLGERAAAQCEGWLDAPLLSDVISPGADADVRAVVSWDPDGAGPLPRLLVAGGDFLSIGGVPASRVAAWDGARWQAVGGGLGATVHDLAVHDGELYAVGEFAGGIRRWTGSDWGHVGGGLGGPGYVLQNYNYGLYVGGSFLAVGGTTASNIARWDGANWSRLQDGLNGPCRALEVFGTDLVVGGSFTRADLYDTLNIATYNSVYNRWGSMGGGVSGGGAAGGVFALQALGDFLMIGGSFNSAGGMPASNIASWTQSGWFNANALFGTGLNGPVYALRMWNGGQFIAGGHFSSADGQTVEGLALWHDGEWSQPNNLRVGGDPIDGSLGRVFDMTHHNGALIVGGDFRSAGGTPADNIARWNGSTWSLMAGVVPEAVRAMAEYRGWHVVGGDFTIPGPSGESGNRLAAWNGATLDFLGHGTNGPVMALATITRPAPALTTLVVGGQFSRVIGTTRPNDIAASNIAEYRGQIGLGPADWAPMGAGLNAPVWAVVQYGNEIVAGGAFTASGATPCAYVARWTGSSWQPMGAGFNNLVTALHVHDGQLYAGGGFTSSGGAQMPGVARWNGSSWQAASTTALQSFGGGPWAYSLASHAGSLYVGGQFNAPGAGVNLARLNGASWAGVGSPNGAVRALVSLGDDLYVGGDFTSVAGVAAQRIARHDGAAWRAAGAGADASVFALRGYRGELQVGGAFAAADGVFSPGWARYTRSCVPWIVASPTPQQAASGGVAQFSVTPAPGYETLGALTYQWRRDGIDLSDARHPGRYAGLATPRLSIVDVQRTDIGRYDVVIAGSDASVTSGAALLTVDGIACLGDVDTDGSAGLSDLSILLAHFGTGDGALYAEGDLDGDADVDLNDLSLLLTRFGRPCP